MATAINGNYPAKFAHIELHNKRGVCMQIRKDTLNYNIIFPMK